MTLETKPTWEIALMHEADNRYKRYVSVESLLRFFEVAMNEETGEVDWNMCQELKMKLEN